MQIFLLELKRVLKSRLTIILIASALVLSLLMAYIPISYVQYANQDKSGKTVFIGGTKAIEAERKIMFHGKITQKAIEEAIRKYNEYEKLYKNIDSDDAPKSIYNKKVLANTNIIKGVNEISQNYNGNDFYKTCGEYLNNFIKGKYTGLKDEQKQAMDMYQKVKKPFFFKYGYGSSDAPEYLSFLIFLLVIICSFMTSPLFSSEYQSGSDSILRCTKHGRKRLAAIKIFSALLISCTVFALCTSIYVIIENSVFGWDSLNTSFQAVSSSVALPNLTVGGVQICTIAAGMLSLISVVSSTMLISARCKYTSNSLIITTVLSILPVIVSIMAGGNLSSLILYMLPAGGDGLMNNFYRALGDWNFIRFGPLHLWSPYMIILAAIIEIPVFVFAALHSYCKHEYI